MSKMNGKWINYDTENLTHSGINLAVKFSDSDAPDDNKVWSSEKIDSISGTLSSDLTTHASSSDHDGRYYTETELDAGQLDNRYYTESEVDALIDTAISGVDSHDELNNLDYASSGHTGFASSGDVTTLSGFLQGEIDAVTGYTTESEYFTLDGTDITNKYVTLANAPTTATETTMDIVGGTTQFYGTDYSVTGTTLTWSGLGLDGIFEAGDIFRTTYTY